MGGSEHTKSENSNPPSKYHCAGGRLWAISRLLNDGFI